MPFASSRAATADSLLPQVGSPFSLNFGGPGWVIGGAWVPPEDRSQNMVPTAVVLAGGRRFSGMLPTKVGAVPRTGQIPARDITPQDRLVAVVAGRIVNGCLKQNGIHRYLFIVRDLSSGKQLEALPAFP